MVEDKKHYSAWINHEIYLTITFSINVEIFALNLGSWGFKSWPNIKNMFYFNAQNTWQTLWSLRNRKLLFLKLLLVDYCRLMDWFVGIVGFTLTLHHGLLSSPPPPPRMVLLENNLVRAVFLGLLIICRILFASLKMPQIKKIKK